jgi:putative FmdB family regulatory protein
MPLYEYQCEHCGERFEKIQKFSDPPVEICPKCGGGPVHKLIAAPAFQFKGTGWYITDYARKDAGGGKSDGAAKESGSAEKTDTTKKDEGTKDGKKPESTTKAETKSDSAPASSSGGDSSSKNP